MTTLDATDVPLTLRLLGPWEARVRGAPLPPLRDRKGAWLLALLALQPGHAAERAWLAGTLWPASSHAQSLANLRKSLKDLRQALGPEACRLRAPTPRSLALDLSGAAVDLLAFDAAIARGGTAEERRDEGAAGEGVLASLAEAVALYRGPLLEGCEEEWVFPERQSREEAYLGALETLAREALANGDAAAAERLLRRAVAVDPLRESAQRGLMELLAAGGSYAAALEVYRELRLRLHRELNTVPDPETVALFQQLRAAARERAAGPGQRSQPLPGRGTGPEAPPLALGPQDSAGLSSAASLRHPDPRAALNGARLHPLREHRPPHNLPLQLTSFIGREDEIAAVTQLLAENRLVTLTGAGGCGKTRLALQVAGERVGSMANGVWLVELAPLADPAMVPRAVAVALDLQEAPGHPLGDTLAHFLRDRELLLVLDNCEHLVQVCAEWADLLLRTCPDLRILATSREALGIAGETRFRVPSLSLPSTLNPQLSTLLQSEAVRLFVERAEKVEPAFQVTPETAPLVAQVCQRLDGMPLAIELAAARVTALSLAQIAARLEDDFRLLTGGSRTALPRQQTLQATLDWSYHLLSEPERALWRRLSVFAGGWTLEAAEAVCGQWSVISEQWSVEAGVPPRELSTDHWLLATKEVLDLLTSLVDKSIVLCEKQGEEARYRLLETVRQYGQDRLVEAGEAAAARDRHVACFVTLAERAEREMEERALVPWLNRLERERDNLRVALEWSQGSGVQVCGCSGAQGGKTALPEHLGPQDQRSASVPPEHLILGLRLAAALHFFWLLRDHQSEGSQSLEDILAAGGDAVPKAVRAKALRCMGGLLVLEGVDQERPVTLLEESLALFRELRDLKGISYALFELAYCRQQQERRGELSQARARREEGLAVARQAGDRFLTALSLWQLGDAACKEGDHQRATALLEESVALGRQLGNPWVLAWSMLALGQSLMLQGEEERAGAILAESDPLVREIGSKGLIAKSRETFARLALERGDHAAAVAYFQENLAIRQELPDRSNVAWALLAMGWVTEDQGDHTAARRYFEATLTLAREIGSEAIQAYALGNLGEIARLRGDTAAAHTHLEEGLAVCRKLPDNTHVLYCAHGILARLALDERDFRSARYHCREHIALAREMGQRLSMIMALEALGRELVAEGQTEEAARLLGAAEALWHPTKPTRESYIHADHQRAAAEARAALGEEAFAAAWARGQAMTLEHAIRCALDVAADG